MTVTIHYWLGVAVIATGAWFDPSPAGDLDVHGNANVLTKDVGTSRLAQGPSALSALCEIECWQAKPMPLTALDPPTFAARARKGAA